MIAIKSGAGSLNLHYIKNKLPMSLLNNNNKKGKKNNQQQKNNSGFPSPKGKTNTKAVAKSTKLPGNAQRGS